MGAGLPKQYLPLNGLPLLLYTLMAFENCPDITGVILVIPPGHQRKVWQEVIGPHRLQKLLNLVEGGAERQHSVFSGLKALPLEARWVVVHDGVRPLVTPELISKCLATARETGAAVAGVPVKDTVKRVDGTGRIVETVPRQDLWLVQTPQVFRREILWEAHQRAMEEGFLGTDDSVLVERLGQPVTMVEGSYQNIKITTPEDLWAAEDILQRRIR